MIRYTVVLLAALGAIAAASAFHPAPAGTLEAAPRLGINQTVIEKNSAFPVLGPVVFQECRDEDCTNAPN